MALDLEKELTFVAFRQLGSDGRSARELGVTRDVGIVWLMTHMTPWAADGRVRCCTCVFCVFLRGFVWVDAVSFVYLAFLVDKLC